MLTVLPLEGIVAQATRHFRRAENRRREWNNLTKEPMSVRELIREIQTSASRDNYTPGEGADDVRKLSSLLGNVHGECRRTETAYKRVLLAAYQQEKTSNRAKLIAETSPEYLAWREAVDLGKELIELTRSLKTFVRNAEDERKYSGLT